MQLGLIHVTFLSIYIYLYTNIHRLTWLDYKMSRLCTHITSRNSLATFHRTRSHMIIICGFYVCEKTLKMCAANFFDKQLWIILVFQIASSFFGKRPSSGCSIMLCDFTYTLQLWKHVIDSTHEPTSSWHYLPLSLTNTCKTCYLKSNQKF